MLIGISGLAGSGKDTAADFLVRHHGFAKVSLADPMKRACAEWFGWDQERLWGPSANRNEPDPRFGGLSARKALQFLGTEIGRELYKDVWIDLGIRIARHLLLHSNCWYDSRSGIFPTMNPGAAGVVIPDVRYENELAAIQQAGGKVVRVKRPGAGLGGAAGIHPSEVDQAKIPDAAFDEVIFNVGTLEDLRADVGAVLVRLRS